MSWQTQFMRYPGIRPVVWSLAVFAIVLLPAVPARAQDLPPVLNPAPKLMDVGDLWRLVRHKDSAQDGEQPAAERNKRYLVFTPSIGSRPATGFSAGFSGNVAFFRGDRETTHISSVSGGLRISQKGQRTGGIRLGMFTEDDRWFLQSENRFQFTSLNTYGLGTKTLPIDAVNLKYNFFRLYETVYRRVKPGFFVGGGLNVSNHTNVRSGRGAHADVDQSAYLAYTQKHGFRLDGQKSSGPSVGLLFDTRDNAINSSRGWMANAVYRTFFEGFLGGDATWQAVNLDVRTYRRLTAGGRNTLAFWFQGNLVTGGTAPFFDLPEIGVDLRSGRGYSEGRYRGDHLLYGEMEYRGTLTSNGLLGVVAFLNATTVDDTETGQKLFDGYAPAAGFGFRVLLNKRSRTNLVMDYGWGKLGSHGFYLSIQEAF